VSLSFPLSRSKSWEVICAVCCGIISFLFLFDISVVTTLAALSNVRIDKIVHSEIWYHGSWVWQPLHGRILQNYSHNFQNQCSTLLSASLTTHIFYCYFDSITSANPMAHFISNPTHMAHIERSIQQTSRWFLDHICAITKSLLILIVDVLSFRVKRREGRGGCYDTRTTALKSACWNASHILSIMFMNNVFANLH